MQSQLLKRAQWVPGRFKKFPRFAPLAAAVMEKRRSSSMNNDDYDGHTISLDHRTIALLTSSPYDVLASLDNNDVNNDMSSLQKGYSLQ